MTVREFASKCNNPYMWVDVERLETKQPILSTSLADVRDVADGTIADAHKGEYQLSIWNILDREVKEFRYVFDLCMEEGFVLYV